MPKTPKKSVLDSITDFAPAELAETQLKLLAELNWEPWDSTEGAPHAKRRRIERALFVDESGTVVGDVNQPWLVLAGIEIPITEVGRVESTYRDICREYLPEKIASHPDLDLKGSELFYPRPGRPPRCSIDLPPFEKRVELGQRLLGAFRLRDNIHYYVSAIDTRAFPESTALGTWPASVKELFDKTCRTYLYALSEMVGDFAFHLDRDMSSGIEELPLPPRDQRWIDAGQLVLDESRHKRHIENLESALRCDRGYEVNGRTLFNWRMLDNNVWPWTFADTKRCVPLQLADILAAIIKLKHSQVSLPRILNSVYLDARRSFQHQSHFWPREEITINELWSHI